MSLSKKISTKQSGILTYGFTPPKENNSAEKIAEIAQRHAERLNQLLDDIDAVVLYDIQDEKERITDERTFPFLPTVDPEYFSNNYLHTIDKPKIIYHCIGKYKREQLINYLKQDPNNGAEKFNVFVGAASDKPPPDQLLLPEAYEIFNQHQVNTKLGAVLIPERHALLHDEHLRVSGKSKSGCSFFISQAVYDLEAAKNFLSDYYYHCLENDIELDVILFTLTPCGSEKTMNFMKWLGISIPKWLENDLLHSQSILDDSVRVCLETFDGLFDFAMEKTIPVGFNIESVSIRKTEIEASIYLTKEVSRRLKQKSIPAL